MERNQVIVETEVLKQQYLQAKEHSNPTILVLEDKNEEITDVVKQTTYSQKTFKRFLKSNVKKKILVVTLFNSKFRNTSKESNKRGWFLIFQGSSTILKLLCYD
jgi:hypothetical protein